MRHQCWALAGWAGAWVVGELGRAEAPTVRIV
jgi:hypothetical protein